MRRLTSYGSCKGHRQRQELDQEAADAWEVARLAGRSSSCEKGRIRDGVQNSRGQHDRGRAGSALLAERPISRVCYQRERTNARGDERVSARKSAMEESAKRDSLVSTEQVLP